jgi:hypothetical protein
MGTFNESEGHLVPCMYPSYINWMYYVEELSMRYTSQVSKYEKYDKLRQVGSTENVKISSQGGRWSLIGKIWST